MKRNPFYVRIFTVGRRYRVCLVYSSNHKVFAQSVDKYRQWRSALTAAEKLAKQCNNATIWLPDRKTP